MEHPHPKVVFSRLSGDLEQRFAELVKSEDPSSFLPGVAALSWYCNHMMPLERGSAAVMMLFTASLLLSKGIDPRPYPHPRLDIDAMSLPREDFVRRFVDAYQ